MLASSWSSQLAFAEVRDGAKLPAVAPESSCGESEPKSAGSVAFDSKRLPHLQPGPRMYVLIQTFKIAFVSGTAIALAGKLDYEFPIAGCLLDSI